ncbi:MAG: putative dolichyl-phosphate beta-D-mannosyltransferase, partial [Actinomyces urogenitalis DORA_12]
MKTVVVIPTYNEIESLPGALDRVRQAVADAHVLVVDDASPDGTGAFADARAERDDHVHVP